jgi:hypothetical protein
MTEKGADDSAEKRQEIYERRKDLWEATNKALNALMVGHGAGLVTCLTLLKDYNAASPGHLKGLGLFIALFGVGLVLALGSAVVWIVGRYNYWIFPYGRRWNVPVGGRDWTTALLAILSTLFMLAAILAAVFNFARL